VQGTTGGGLVPLSQAILLETFPVEERGKAMAFWGMGMIAIPILGPMIGGWLTDNYSWRWVFYVNLPVGVLSLVLMHFYVFDPPYLKRTTTRIDGLGLSLLVVGMGAFQYILDKGQEEDWFGSDLIVSLSIVSALALAAFVVRELRAEEPLVDFRLFRFTTFTTGVFVGGVVGFVLYGSIVLLPLFMQQMLNFPAVDAGLWSAPRGIGTMIFMPLTGILLGRRWDPRILLTSGLVMTSVSFFSYSGLNLQAGGTDFLWPQIIQGAGLAMVFVPLTTIAMDPIPLERMGFATAVYNLVRNMGSSTGISFVTTQLYRRAQLHQARLTESVSAYNQTLRDWMGPASAAGRSGVTSERLAGLYGQVVRQASALSFLELFRLLGVMFLLVAPLVWLMRRPRHLSRGEPAH
jgi:MFS transporter, DHA2 family, multidrug resistance protein